RLNGDKEHAEEAVRTIGYVPEWMAGPDTNAEVRAAITISPEMRAFIADYVRRGGKKSPALRLSPLPHLHSAFGRRHHQYVQCHFRNTGIGMSEPHTNAKSP